MTSLPAQFMGFQDRGMLREGYKADITIFDLDEIKDKATFFEPHQYPEGIYHVIVNGTFLVEDSQLKEHTLPGEVLHVKNSRRYAKIKP
jgi:N-acyl-D-amino-acid deacylase